MSTSFIYHAFGLRGYTHTRHEFLGGSIILRVTPKPKLVRCPNCRSYKVIKRGHSERWVKTLPIGMKPVWVVIPVPRVECRACGCLGRIDIKIAEARKWHTHAFERYALALSCSMTLKDVAEYLGISWDTIKDIKKRYLSKKFAKPRLKGLKYIAIDEISIGTKKYLTIVLDLVRGIVVYVGEGKDAEALAPFWKRLRRSGARIEGVAME